MRLPGVPGRASGVGSWPGTDVREAVRTTLGELGEPPHVPYLPELPGRGPGAEMVGRSAALLVDLPVDLQPSGWRLVDRPGRDLARARAWLAEDLDALAELAADLRGPFKVQVAGPWTLAAELRLPRLERAVVDPGACRDLVSSLAEGVGQHVQQVRRLLPGAQVVVQLDEPSLPDVLAGGLRTTSGFGRLPAVEEQVVVDGLRTVLDAAAAGAAGTVVHCCAAAVPVPLLVRAGAGALGLDVSLLGQQGWEAVAAAVEAGVGLWAGAVPVPMPGPAGDAAPPRPDAVADAVWVPWRRLGLKPALLAEVVTTPACGLAGLRPDRARAALATARQSAAVLAERAEG